MLLFYFIWILAFILENVYRKYRVWVLVFWCCESSSLQQQKRPASSLLSSNIHPPSPPLLRLRRGRSHWEGRRTKPRWKKWPFNTRENNPEETWILCISLSSTISSSSPPCAPSPLLLTGDSVSKLTGDYFLRGEQSGVELSSEPFWRQTWGADCFCCGLCKYCISGLPRTGRLIHRSFTWAQEKQTRRSCDSFPAQ